MEPLSENLTELIAQKERIASEVNSQSGLISQIKTVLQQKASGEVPPSKLAGFIDGSLTEITASDLKGVTEIRERAFYYSPITSVVIPNSVKKIGMYAFGYCTAQIDWEENPTIDTLDGYSFSIYNGSTISIPNSVTAINDYAFSSCGCVEILLPNSIKRIGGGVFQSCANLTNIEIPNSITDISVYAFQNCSKLASVTLPNSVTSIGSNAFQGCNNLTSITIPNSVTTIGNYALYIGSSTNKATIRFLGTTPPTITTSTFNANNLEKIIVPKGYGDTYKQATNWANFADYIVESET